MKLAVLNQNGEKVSETAVPEIFTVSASSRNTTLYLNYLRAALRSPIANTLGRGEVSGGGRKPWRQKGTGNARAGSTRSPLWVGGGVTFGPTSERNFHLRMNQQARRSALLGLLSDLAQEKKVIIVDNISLKTAKTRDAVEILNKLGTEGKIALIITDEDVNTGLSFRNIAGLKVMTPHHLDFLYLLGCNKVILTKAVLKQLADIFGSKKTVAIGKDTGKENNE